MIKCPECQKELSDDVKFCENCGYKFPEEEEKKEEVPQESEAKESKPETDAEKAEAAPDEPNEPKTKKKKKLPVWAIILIIVAALTVIGLYLSAAVVGLAAAGVLTRLSAL